MRGILGAGVVLLERSTKSGEKLKFFDNEFLPILYLSHCDEYEQNNLSYFRSYPCLVVTASAVMMDCNR